MFPVIFSAAMMKGSEDGSRSFQRVCNFVAPYTAKRSTLLDVADFKEVRAPKYRRRVV